MSGQVTEEIVSNLIKSNLTHLKTFAELLNAEFTEEGHDEANRDKFKEDVSRILDKFGSAEADFKKTLTSLASTKSELVNASGIVEGEESNPQVLAKEVDDIINIFEGKARSNDPDPPFEEFDENRVFDVLEKVEDILGEFNPMKYRDDDDPDEEDANEREEQRMLKVLDEFQKKNMKKHEQSINEQSVVDDEDDENAMEVDTNDAAGDDDTTEDEDEEEAGPSGNTQRQSTSNEGAKRDMDKKLKKMWNTYQQDLKNVELKSLKDIYVKKSSETADIPLEHLTHYPKFCKSILELFSHEAVVVCGGKENYIDPFTKVAIQHPIRNKLCSHVYERDTVLNVIKAKKQMSCPNVGCAVKFTKNDLEEDEELTERVTQSLTQRNNDSQQSTASANASNAEYLDDSDMDSD